MDKEDEEEYGKVMKAIFKKKKEAEELASSEDFELVSSDVLTADDRAVLNAMRDVHDRHLVMELRSKDSLFRPCDRPNTPLNMYVDPECMIKKCRWLTQFHNVISEVAGQRNFSALSDSKKKGILTALWIFHTMSKVEFSAELQFLFNKENTGGFVFETCVLQMLDKSLKQLKLDEDEMQIFSVYFIHSCLQNYLDKNLVDFELMSMVEKAVFKYEQAKVDGKLDGLDKTRFENIVQQQEQIFSLILNNNVQEYLWNFLGQDQTPNNLDKHDWRLLYLLFFVVK